MPDIFISYSSKDREQAQQLTELLGSAGLSVWIDQSSIEAATSWSGEISKAITDCKALIVLLSPSSVDSKNVTREVALAFERNKKILPIDLEPVTLPDDFAYHLAGIQRTPIANVDAIIRALGTAANNSSIQRKQRKEHPQIVKKKRRSFPLGKRTAYFAIVLLVAISAFFVRGYLGTQSGDELKKKYPQGFFSKNTEATALWIKSVNLKERTPEIRAESIRLLENSIALDSNFALAYATLGSHYLDTVPEHLLYAQKLLRRAMALEPTMAACYGSMARLALLQGDSSGALESALRGISLSDNASPMSAQIARACLLSKGEFARAFTIEQEYLQGTPSKEFAADWFLYWLSSGDSLYSRSYAATWKDSLIRYLRSEPMERSVLVSLVLMLDFSHDNRLREYIPELESSATENEICAEGLFLLNYFHRDAMGISKALRLLERVNPVSQMSRNAYSNEPAEVHAYLSMIVAEHRRAFSP